MDWAPNVEPGRSHLSPAPRKELRKRQHTLEPARAPLQARTVNPR